MAASTYPQFFRVRQKFPRPRVDDVAGEVHTQLSRLNLGGAIQPGQTVAITAGSRGIANIAIIIRAIVEHLKALEAKPFIVPAMGSHGGGTAAGQRAVIESYGITEAFCGCPIRSDMDTVMVCQTPEGTTVHFDRQAYEADHVFVCGRVKPHTRFSGDIESGLMKMMTLGLGKHEGAKACHAAIQALGFEKIMRSAAGEVLKRCKIVAGLAIVENGYDETARIEAMHPGDIEAREKELLKLARQLMPRLPFEGVDLLIVDEMGKDISGSGMDTNVVGRKDCDAARGSPAVQQIVVRSLTEASRGNAYGIGMAEFCSAALLRQIDQAATQLNGQTSGNTAMVQMPRPFASEREVLDAALATLGLADPLQAKIVWIRNTLQLAEVECSAAFLADAQQRTDLEIVSPLDELALDSNGNLPRFE